MPRLGHGEVVTHEQVEEARRELAGGGGGADRPLAAPVGPDLQDFDFLFGDLQQDPAKLLPQAAKTNGRLKLLGRSMVEPGDDPDPGDSRIPAVYTYFGQFIDHDITLEETSLTADKLVAANMVPLSLERIRRDIRNTRTATLELDSLYGPPTPRDPANRNKLKVGNVTRLKGLREVPDARVRLKGDDNDLPRRGKSPDPRVDREALIGDPRNDENLIVSQLHVAFLKAHNALVDKGNDFAKAQRLLRQHYQHLVIHDFLKRVTDPAIVDRILRDGNKVYDAMADPFFLPLEFTVAAFRLGHTMVRDEYDFNLNFEPATLDLLFTFTALSGQLGFGAGNPTLPDNWIIEWHRFVDTPDAKARNKARVLDTKLGSFLFGLRDFKGAELPKDQNNLAVRNLLRGYALRLPTGQAVARALGVEPLSADDLQAAARSPGQAKLLQDAGFLDRTPLWYYLLAEARHSGPGGGKGQRLGTVGGTIVAEVLIGLVRRTQDSILNTPGWKPTIPSAQPGRFELADLLRFAGVLPRTYKAKQGDTVRGIAKAQLRAEGRWPEVFVLNRERVAHRDKKIPAGRVLLLPGNTPKALRPKLHTIKAGDTLGKLAKRHLGDVNRFPEIHTLNRDVLGPDPDRIQPGKVLVILPP